MGKDPRKVALKQAWRDRERKKLRGSIPIPPADLRELFDYLDRKDAPPCDHTLRQTTRFLQDRKFSAERVVPWLHEHGGYCDCEVLANVESKFGDLIRES